jgi:hypothetical protein
MNSTSRYVIHAHLADLTMNPQKGVSEYQPMEGDLVTTQCQERTHRHLRLLGRGALSKALSLH